MTHFNQLNRGLAPSKHSEVAGTVLRLRGDILGELRRPGEVASAIKNHQHSHLILAQLKRTLLLKPEYSVAVFGHTFPKELSQLRASKNLRPSGDLVTELKWLEIMIQDNFSQLAQFVSLRNEFSTAILCGQFTSAVELLDRIENQFGYSLWSLENRFALYEHAAGLEKNKEALAGLNEKSPVALVAFIMDWQSRKAESDLSADTFTVEFDNSISKTPIKAFFLSQYLKFKIDHTFIPEKDSLAYIIAHEHKSSIIDRYDTFIRTCQILSEEYEDERLRKYLKGATIRIAIATGDELIINLATVFNPKNDLAQIVSKSAYEILDAYSVGEYTSAINNSCHFLSTQPHSIEIMVLLARACIYANQPLPIIDLPPNSLALHIAKAIHSLYLRQTASGPSLNLLKKYAQSFGSTPWTHQILGIIATFTHNDARLRPNLLALAISYQNPELAFCMKDGDAQIYLDSLQDGRAPHPTIELLAAYVRQRQSKEDVQFPTHIPKNRCLRFYGLARLSRREYDLAQPAFIAMLGNSPDKPEIPFLFEENMIALLDCYKSNNDFYSAINLIVSAYFKNPYLIQRIDLSSIAEDAVKSRDSLIKSSSERLILFSLALQTLSVKPHRTLHGLYQDFARANGFKRPSDIIQSISQIGHERAKYILRHVCIPEVLEYSTAYASSAEMEAERIRVCQELTLLDSENATEYAQEIAALSEKMVLAAAMVEIEERKIFVNIQGIQNSVSDRLGENFQRYERISRMPKDLQFIQPSNTYREVAQNFDETLAITEQEPNFVDNYHLITFREMFLDLRDKFAFDSQNGLNSYLSLRVRHGKLISQLRNVLESANLVTQKGASTRKYLVNDYWISNLELSEQEKSRIQKAFTKFSARCDALLHEINDNWMQISTETQPSLGMFDYSYNDDELLHLYETTFQSLDDVEEFFETTIAELWIRTESLLDAIRGRLSNDARARFMKLFDELYKETSNSESAGALSSLNAQIAECRAGFSHEIDRVISWFTVRSSNQLTAFTLDRLFEVCAFKLKNLNRGRKIDIDIKNSDSVQLQQDYLLGFIDIVDIILENFMKHTYKYEEYVNITLESICQGDLTLRITAIMPERIDPGPLAYDLTKRWQEVAQQTSTDAASREGKSGFPKIKKLLETDLSRRNYGLTFDPLNNAIVIQLITELEGLLNEDSLD